MLHQARAKVEALFSGQQRALLQWHLEAHENARRPPIAPFIYSWSSPCMSKDSRDETSNSLHFWGYETALLTLDLAALAPSQALEQILNILSFQTPTGLIPAQGSFAPHASSSPPRRGCLLTFPPLWAFALEDLLDQNLIKKERLTPLLEHIEAYIHWYDAHRSGSHGGYIYLDLLDGVNESRLYPSLRHSESEHFFLDASSHVYLLMRLAKRLSQTLCGSGAQWHQRLQELQLLIEHYEELRSKRPSSLLSLYPLMVGALDDDRAQELLVQEITSAHALCTPHPLASLSKADPRFDASFQLGPVFMTYVWLLARALKRYYHRERMARKILQQSLNMVSLHFSRTSTVWECYHPLGEHPQQVIAHLHQEQPQPPRASDLANNPLIAIAFALKEDLPS